MKISNTPFFKPLSLFYQPLTFLRKYLNLQKGGVLNVMVVRERKSGRGKASPRRNKMVGTLCLKEGSSVFQSYDHNEYLLIIGSIPLIALLLTKAQKNLLRISI